MKKSTTNSILANHPPGYIMPRKSILVNHLPGYVMPPKSILVIRLPRYIMPRESSTSSSLFYCFLEYIFLINSISSVIMINVDRVTFIPTKLCQKRSNLSQSKSVTYINFYSISFINTFNINYISFYSNSFISVFNINYINFYSDSFINTFNINYCYTCCYSIADHCIPNVFNSYSTFFLKYRPLRIVNKIQKLSSRIFSKFSILFLDRTLHVFYDVFSTIVDLKLLLASITGIHHSDFYLSTSFKYLNDSMPLHVYDIKPNGIIVNFRLKGGNDDIQTHDNTLDVSQISPFPQRSFFLDKDSSPNTWLLLLDFSFSSRRFNTCTKAQHVLSLLPTELLQSLGSKIITTMNSAGIDHYANICDIVRDFYKPSETELFDTYFRTQTLGTLTPSQFLSRARSDLDRLHPGSSSNVEILRRFFIAVLPPTVRAILASSDKSSIEDLASSDDRVMLNLPSSTQISNIDSSFLDLLKNLSDQVASLQLEVSAQRRSRSPIRSSIMPTRPRSCSAGRLICKDHFNYRDASKKCCIGCSWTNNQSCEILPICIFHSIFAADAKNCLTGCTFQKNL